MRRTLFAHLIILGVLALCTTVAPAIAQDGCGKFAWPLLREQALFTSSAKVAVKANDKLASLPTAAFSLNLQPGKEASFAMPPERKPRIEKWFGGIVRLPAPDKTGIYQVTLSDEAWVDVVQDGRYARSVGSTGRGDCPGVRKSVRFELSATPFVLQLSGTGVDVIAVAIGVVP